MNSNYPSLEIEPKITEESRGYQIFLGLLLGIGYLTLLPAFAYEFIYFAFGNFPGIEIAAQVITGLVVLLLLVFILQEKVDQMIRSVTKNDWKIAFQFALYMYLGGVLWTLAQVLITGTVSTNENQQALQMYVSSSPINLGILTVVVAPLLEELIFRYFVFGSLKKHNVYLAFFLSIALFAGIHFLASLSAGTLGEDLVTLPPYLISAGLLTYIYYKTNRIGTSILTHFIYNFFVFFLMIFVG